MKKILGLDLGTNSVGWAVINSVVYDEGKEQLAVSYTAKLLNCKYLFEK